jgi:hypothetical protein
VRAGSALGRTKAVMLAHDFTVEILRRSVLEWTRDGVAGTVYAGGRPIKVTG